MGVIMSLKNKNLKENDNLDVQDQGLNENTSDNLNKDLDELKGKLLEQENKTNDYLELSKRIQADFENYKKRNSKENKQLLFLEKKILLIEFLNFRNILNLALKSEINDTSKNNLNQLLFNFDNILKRLNIQKIDCLDKEFDFNNSECVCKNKISDISKQNKVIEVLEDGYLLNNNLIKPAKVIVGYMEE